MLHAILLRPLQSILNFFKASTSTKNNLHISDEVKQQNGFIRQTELGVFSYNETGFELNLKTEFHSIKWADIERIASYKADLLTTDEICLDIIYDNKMVVLTEETHGWHQFIERLQSALPIKDNWEAAVLKSPFEYNLTTVYERIDRKMPQQSNFFSVIEGSTKEEVSYLFQKEGWKIHKPSMKAYQLSNSWTELVLDTDSNGSSLLLHGLVAYFPDNVKALETIFDRLECPYKFEFYDEQNELQFEKKNGM